MSIPVIVLAGGLGTRMLPMTAVTPKCLLPVCGRPFAHWQRDWLRAQGFADQDIVYSIGYRAKQVSQSLGPTHRYVWDGPQPKGQVGAIRLARELLNEPEWFYVLYGDVYPRYGRLQLDTMHAVTQGSVVSRSGDLLDCGFNLYKRGADAFSTVQVLPSYEIGSPNGYADFCAAVSRGGFPDSREVGC